VGRFERCFLHVVFVSRCLGWMSRYSVEYGVFGFRESFMKGRIYHCIIFRNVVTSSIILIWFDLM